MLESGPSNLGYSEHGLAKSCQIWNCNHCLATDVQGVFIFLHLSH